MGLISETDVDDVRRHRLDAQKRIERERRSLPSGNRDGHRLTNGPRNGQEKRSQNSRERCGDNHADRDLMLCRTEGISRLAERLRNRRRASSLSEVTIGMIMMPTTIPALAALNTLTSKPRRR